MSTRNWTLGAVLALALAWGWLPEFTITLLCYIGLYALVAAGLVMLTGVGGMTSFGQAAFVGVGAYATAWVCTSPALAAALGGSIAASWLPWLGLLLGLLLQLRSCSPLVRLPLLLLLLLLLLLQQRERARGPVCRRVRV